jgi:hypothetical protein
VKFFAERMQRKFNLVPFSDPLQPTVIYGLYNPDDFDFYRVFTSPAIVLWRGTDSLVMTPAKAAIVLAKKNARHYAASKNVHDSLKKFGIESEILPITSTDPGIKCEPRGDCVYCYISSKHPVMFKKYKMQALKWLERKTRLKFIYTTIHQYKGEALMNVYRKCFVGIRLLDHDGMSNSILEMGLMGRRTISNSHLPYTIRWKTLEDIRRAIIKQYQTRHRPNQHISDEYRQLIDIGDKWLEI